MALEPPQPIHLALEPLVSETVELTHGLSHARPCPGFREATGYDRYAKPSRQPVEQAPRPIRQAVDFAGRWWS